MKEMLLLNPDDNQGIRHTLITRLLILNRFLEADKLYEDYRDDYSAQWYYSKAYLYFNKRSKQLYADKVLKEAMEFNPYVPLYLFQIEEMPDELPDYVSPGDENEAIVYAAESFELWAENEKTLRWFIRTFKKMQDKLERLIEQRDKEMEERFGRFNR